MNNRLMEKIASPENLLLAWRAVRGNIPKYRRARSAGPDGISLEEFERDLAAQLFALRYQLLKDRYQPQPPGIITVKKKDGGHRLIALLNVTDRVAQRATQQVIEPLWEPQFLPCNYGFRPGRSLQEAAQAARLLRQRGYAWVVDGDITACFDHIDHHILQQKLARRIPDPRVLRLLETWVQPGLISPELPNSPAENFLLPDLAVGVEKARRKFQRINDFVSKTAADVPVHPQPYFSDPVFGSGEEIPLPEDTPYPAERQAAMRQITTGGLLLGMSWLRPVLRQAGTAALTMLQSPAGRLALVKGSLLVTGLVGVTTGVVIGACQIGARALAGQSGILQGSPLSPLLANIYLHSFDASMIRAGYHLLRYADDWVVLCPDEQTADRAYNQAILSLDRLRLKINPQKTHICPPDQPVEWLGEQI